MSASEFVSTPCTLEHCSGRDLLKLLCCYNLQYALFLPFLDPYESTVILALQSDPNFANHSV